MVDKFQINPFDRTALTDFKQLAGRSNEFRQIRFILRTASKNKNRIKSILITGERGVGKTSFLNLIESESEINNIIPIRIDLTEANSANSNDFFWHLFNQAINKLFSLNYFDGKTGSIDTMIQNILNKDGILDPANWVFKTPILRRNYLNNKDLNFEFSQFIDDLRLMKKEVNEKQESNTTSNFKFLFLVDESQHIYSNKKIIEEIRYVIQSQELGVGFVFAGDSSYKTSTWESVFGGSIRDFEIVHLPYFTDVEAVSDYFIKSLTSVNWTEEEVEEHLFYRFKLACRNIFKLTSGKPAWINIIASKMFERCMSGEVKQLKFDKQAQTNVKRMLEDSGDLDKTKLAFIDRLPYKYDLWLAEIFVSELHTLREVYMYAKFKLSGENYIDISEFKEYCKDLVSREIITLIEVDEKEKIGFTPTKNEKHFLDKHYYAFGINSDTIKQWLQITTEGKYSFHRQPPSIRFISYINDELVTEKINSVFISSRENYRLSTEIQKINSSEFDVNDESFETLSLLYAACKLLEESATKQILYVELKNEITGKSITNNIYNYNDKNKLLAFRESPSTVSKIKSLVERFNDEETKYSITLEIDKVIQTNLNTLQRLIINSDDSKKISIILKAKMEDMITFYIKESNVESSFEVAEFFYKIFEEGHDLRLKDLNNTAYVFIEKNELNKAITLLKEAIRQIKLHGVVQEEFSAAALIYYNLGILFVKNQQYKEALIQFEDLINFFDEHDIRNEVASVLKYLKKENNLVSVEEIRESKKFSQINIKEFTIQNIQILKEPII